MPVTAAYLAACRTAIENLPELTAFRAAGVVANDSRAERQRNWGRLYAVDLTGTSPADRLRIAMRKIVVAQAQRHATAGSGIVSLLERESTYRDFVTEYCPAVEKPQTNEQELAALETAINQGILT